jgi:hypothetical protein
MKGAREFLTIWALLIGGFLVLEHFTGFSSDVNALGKNLTGLSKTLQGR